MDVRERKQNGAIADNYLYKVYTYRDKSYPDGLWLIELRHYKTGKTHGTYTIPIANRQYDDGTCTNDYIEHYLGGRWIRTGYRNRSIYTWWDERYIGKRGFWITKGWMEFEPILQQAIAPNWPWGHFFVMPTTGEPYNARIFETTFATISAHYLAKRILPHRMRDIWATWAFQVEKLTFKQRESLAFAMGHTYETMRRVYLQIKEEERLDPILEAIDTFLFNQVGSLPNSPENANPVEAIANQFFQLTPEEQAQLMKLIQDNVA